MITKERILSAALPLFNRYGYDKVTMRMISDTLGISVGNLTYHYPHKQDIAAALMDARFSKIQETTAGQAATLSQLITIFEQMLITLTENTFFFLDSCFASSEHRTSEHDTGERKEDKRKATEHQEHHQLIRQSLLASMAALTQRGIFSPAFTAEVRETVLSMLLMTHMTWLRQCIRGSDPPPMDMAAFLRAHMVILSPYLTPQGFTEYAKIKDKPPLRP